MFILNEFIDFVFTLLLNEYQFSSMVASVKYLKREGHSQHSYVAHILQFLNFLLTLNCNISIFWSMYFPLK